MKERKQKRWLLPLLLLPHENEDCFHVKEKDDCFFLCCCFHIGQRIVFHNERKMDHFFFFFVFACHMMKHRTCFPRRERKMDCFHVNEKKDGSLLFFLVPPWERKRDGLLLLLLLLLLPHEDKDCMFCTKNMIVFFAFTWDQGFVSHMKAWNTGS